MRSFIRRFLQPMFCEHNWELLFNVYVEDDFGSTWSEKTYRCRKCGLQRKYKSCWKLRNGGPLSLKTHYPEIKKDPLYQEALYKVYKNNPELIESQQKSNAEKKQRLNAIKINKICMAFSILYVLFMALIGTLLNENFWYEMGIGMGVVLVAKEAHFIITDIIFWRRMANEDFQLYRKWKFEFAKVGYEIWIVKK